MRQGSGTHGHGHGGHGHDAHENGGHHVIPVKTYVGVIAWLMVLLIVTLGAAAVDLGMLNLPIAMLIAVVKAAIVMVFFMHLKYSSKLVVLFATIAFLFLAIMFVFSFNDYAARGWHPLPSSYATD
jgi:cytochrome c oxidase subunit 4